MPLATDGWQASLLMILLFNVTSNILKHICYPGTKAWKKICPCRNKACYYCTVEKSQWIDRVLLFVCFARLVVKVCPGIFLDICTFPTRLEEEFFSVIN